MLVGSTLGFFSMGLGLPAIEPLLGVLGDCWVRIRRELGEPLTSERRPDVRQSPGALARQAEELVVIEVGMLSRCGREQSVDRLWDPHLLQAASQVLMTRVPRHHQRLGELVGESVRHGADARSLATRRRLQPF